jgi:hypothetical protein
VVGYPDVLMGSIEVLMEIVNESLLGTVVTIEVLILKITKEMIMIIKGEHRRETIMTLKVASVMRLRYSIEKLRYHNLPDAKVQPIVLEG